MAETFSLDDIDKIIETEDPAFKNELADIKKQKVVGTDAIENFKVDPPDDMVKEGDEQPSTAKKIMRIILWPWFLARTFVRIRWVRIKSNSRTLLSWAFRFLRHELPERIKYTWSRLKALKNWFGSEWKKFQALNST